MRRPFQKILWCLAGAAAIALVAATSWVYYWSGKSASHRPDLPPYSTLIRSNNPDQIRTEADRLALLANWSRAGPLFARAEQIYGQRGDSRDELYCRIGELRSEVEKRSYSEVGRAIREKMTNPLVRNDRRLKLEGLTALGVIDMNTDTRAALKDWTEVMDLAQSLNDKVWEARATGWLGILAFIDGKTARGGRLVMEAILKATLYHDAEGEIDFLSYFGEGLNEYHRPQQALNFFNRALKLADATPDIGTPFHIYIGEISALEQLNRRQEAQSVLNRALDEANRSGILGAQADLLRQAGELAVQDHDLALARNYYERCAAVSEKAHLTRLLADAMFKLTDIYEQTGDLSNAERCVVEGIKAVRQVEAPYQLPHYLGIEAGLKESKGQYREADALFSEANDLVEGMLLSVSSSSDESSLIGTMSEIYVGRFHLAATFLKDDAKAFEVDSPVVIQRSDNRKVRKERPISCAPSF